MADKRESIRLSLDSSANTNTRLEHLAGEMDIGVADTLKRALALLEIAVAAKKEGCRIGTLDEEGWGVTEITGV